MESAQIELECLILGGIKTDNNDKISPILPTCIFHLNFHRRRNCKFVVELELAILFEQMKIRQMVLLQPLIGYLGNIWSIYLQTIQQFPIILWTIFWAIQWHK